MLDEQLSRTIGETLKSASIMPSPPASLPSPPSSQPTPTPVLPTNISLKPRPMQFAPTPPPAYGPPVSAASSVPQLPGLDFTGFELDDFPLLCKHNRKASPPASPPALDLPSWCPALPSLLSSDPWRTCLPIFFDLSSLPEPKKPTVPKYVCANFRQAPGNELDTLPPALSVDLKAKQSRFFPPKSLMTTAELGQDKSPKVKLPPIACALHPTDNGPPSVQAFVEEEKSGSIAESNELAVEGFLTALTAKRDNADAPNATNLWRILCRPETQQWATRDEPYLASFKRDATTSDPCIASFGKLPLSSNPVFGTFETALEPVICESPAELDSIEVPYVHPNALAGYANEFTGFAGQAIRGPIIDSAVCLSPTADVDTVEFYSPLPDPFFEQMLHADHALTAVTMPPTPPLTPHSGSISDLAEVLPIDCIVDNCHATMTEADAHYQSEQELFERPAASVLVSSPEASVMDIATFLKLGHPRDCWCGYCDEEFQIVPEESDAELVDVGSPVDEDDGWSWYSDVENGGDVLPASETGATVVSEEVKEVTAYPCVRAPEWDVLFPKLPCSVREVGCPSHGNKDLSLGFAHDHDWECEF